MKKGFVLHIRTTTARHHTLPSVKIDTFGRIHPERSLDLQGTLL
jgi:hypothetical protein